MITVFLIILVATVEDKDHFTPMGRCLARDQFFLVAGNNSWTKLEFDILQPLA
jgi:hypothetical protein